MKFLLIDEERTFVRTVAQSGRLRGLSVATACDPEEGRQQAVSGDFDAIIAEEGMHSVRGSEIFRQVRERNPDCTLVLVTGEDDRAIGQRAFECGADHLLAKPFDPPSSLWDHVLGILDESRARHALLRLGRLVRELHVVEPRPAAEGTGSWTDDATDLTPAEIAVLDFVLAGKDTRTIARQRGVAISTVRDQLRSIYRKLHVHSRVELVLRCRPR